MKNTILKNLLLTLIKQLLALITLLEAKLEQKKQKDFEAFKIALGKRESGNRYNIVNAYGFMGRWQFGMARLCDLGYTERKVGMTGYSNSSFQWKTWYSQEYFLNSPDFQDKVFREHCNNLIRSIDLRFSDFSGKVVNNIQITLSGLVAGAHLGGLGGVSHFLIDAYNSSDANGTKVGDYIKEFGGYNLKDMS